MFFLNKCIFRNGFQEFERARAFLFLTEINRRFIQTYGLQVATAIAYGMNTEFSRILASEMKHYSESKEVDAITRVHGQIDELKDIMVKNIGKQFKKKNKKEIHLRICHPSIENVTTRGERLELLVNKTENLRDTSVSFRKTSRNLARAMFWKNVKLYVIVGLILLFIVYIIVSMACGGLAWQSCIKK